MNNGYVTTFILPVFSKISRDSGATDEVIDFRQDRKVEKRLLTEYKVISDALDRLGLEISVCFVLRQSDCRS